MSKFANYFSFVLFLFVISSRLPVFAENIPLNYASPPDIPFPVATGIPFPRGVLKSLNNLKIINNVGREIPAQFELLAKWPDQSLKDVLVILFAEPNASYILQFGTGINRPQYPSSFLSQDSATALEVSTGPLKVRFDKKNFSFFDQMWLDSNGNHQFEENEKILNRPGDIFIVDAHDNKEYRSSLFHNPKFVIEEKGPIRIVVRVSGKFQSQDGKNLLEIIDRFYFYNGTDYFTVDQTVVDTREEKDVEAKRDTLPLAIQSYGFRLPYQLGIATYAFGGEVGTASKPKKGEAPTQLGSSIYYGPLIRNAYLFQGGAFRYKGALLPFEFGYNGVGQGKKAAGWMDVRGVKSGITLMVKDFWQQFPKELALENKQAMIYFHPPRATEPKADITNPRLDPATKLYVRPNTFYSPREGIAKTYQFLIHLNHGNKLTVRSDVLNHTYQTGPRLVAPASWYAQSKVYGDLLPAGPWSRGYDAFLFNEVYVPSVEKQKENGGLAILYGWRDFGDRLRPGWNGEYRGVKIPAFYNDTHVGANVYFVEYLRTLDNRWWDFAEKASRHWMDIDVSHSNRKGYWQENKKYVSFGPGEGHLIKHDVGDHSSRNIHWGHAHVSGLPNYYFLTGDRRALEVLREVGDWWIKAVPVFYPLPIKNPHVAEAERDYAWPLYVLNEAYRTTGDARYFKAATHLMQHLIAWWQTPSDHYLNGKKIGHNDWKKGTGWWHMWPRMDNSPDPPRGKILNNGTNPWMAGPLISQVMEYYEHNKDVNAIDNKLVLEMAMQTMNYVVKYGYEESKKWKNYPYFVYAETARETDGGANFIIPPLAKLGKLYAEGKITEHREWYDTAPRWLSIADRKFQDWKISKPRSTTSAGFYGYEVLFPADFWANMVDAERKGLLQKKEVRSKK
jgi:hypothetical protein